MEIKPVEEVEKSEYPKKEQVPTEKKKKKLSKWAKIGIGVGIAVAVGTIGFYIYYENSVEGSIDYHYDYHAYASIPTFNARFNSYEGTKVSPASVIALITTVKQHNAISSEVAKYGRIKIRFDGYTEDDNILKMVEQAKTYTVICSYDNSSGIVNKVVITTN